MTTGVFFSFIFFVYIIRLLQREIYLWKILGISQHYNILKSTSQEYERSEVLLND